MFGFQTFTKGVFRAASRYSISQFSSSKQINVNWAFKS